MDIAIKIDGFCFMGFIVGGCDRFVGGDLSVGLSDDHVALQSGWPALLQQSFVRANMGFFAGAARWHDDRQFFIIAVANITATSRVYPAEGVR